MRLTVPAPFDDRGAHLRRRVADQQVRMAALDARSRAARRAACETGLRADMAVLRSFAGQLSRLTAR